MKDMRNSRRILLLAIVVLSVAAAPALYAQLGLNVKSNVVLAPASIPVPGSGTVSIGMTRLELRSITSGVFVSISQIKFKLLTTGAFAYTDIQSVQVYYEPSGGLDTFDNDNGSTGTGDDVNVLSSYSYDIPTSTYTVDLNASLISFDNAPSSWMYVVLEFQSDADTNSTIMCDVTDITYGAPPTGTGSAWSGHTAGYALPESKKPLDTWLTTISATEEAPASADQGTEKVPVLRFELDAVDTSAPVVPSVDTIILHKIGTVVDADINAGGVLLYEDVDKDGLFEPGGDDGLAITFSSLTGGVATLTPTANLTFTSTAKAYWVAVNVHTDAVIGHTVGLEISNPSTDIVYEDTTADAGVLNQYTQKGYLTGTTAIPVANTPFTITELLLPDTDPPDISFWDPTGAGVARSTNITVVFDENMNAATIIPSNVVFQVNGGATVDGTINFVDALSTMTFDPTPANLDMSTVYRMTIKGASSGGTTADEAGNVMTNDFTWTFTVIGPTPPTVQSTSPGDGATGIPRNSVITVTFNENVTGVDASTIVVTTGGTPVTPLDVTYDSGTWTATFTPLDLLGFNKTYIVTVDPAGGTSIADMDGTPMAGPYTFDFQTTTTLPLVVLAVNPAKNAVGASTSSVIRVTFSKEMNGSTVNGSTFTVQDSRGQYVDGDVYCETGSMEATFTPDELLPYTTFTVTLAASIEDTVGQTLGTDEVWTFSTILDVGEPIAANNRIRPGVNDRTVIFIPQPPVSAGGADARLTVQVFTATGKRVATLVNARTYSDLVASLDLPLLWYGRNSQGDPLGPGLYFIRISATGWVRTLKVMVVR